jgi:hypothetical protein
VAQHDYIIANQSGAATRSDLNNALAAIVSQNSGAVQPSTTYAYQWWADTTAGVLKLRNAANSGWITLLQLDGEWTTLAVENGTAAAPSIYFKDSGTDTGFFSPGVDQAAIATGGVQRLLVDASGNATFSADMRAASFNGGPLAGLRNRIINGDFDVWQRGVVPFTLSNYGVDRWLHARNNTTQSVSRQSFTLGQTAVPNEPTYFCRTAVTSVTGAANYALLLQRIEDVRTFAGQQVTLSLWAKADATRNISVELSQFFGNGGSPSAVVDGLGVNKVSIGTSWQKITVTTTLPSISGKTLGTNNDHFLGINIWFDAGSTYNSRTSTLGQQSGTFDIAQVQLEPGPVATPFEHRSQSQELALCQRYFRKVTFAGGGYSEVNVGYFSPEGIEDMFTRPTFTPSAAYGFQWYNGTTGLWQSTNTGITFSIPILLGGERILMATGLTGNVANITTPCAGVFYGQLTAEL